MNEYARVLSRLRCSQLKVRCPLGLGRQNTMGRPFTTIHKASSYFVMTLFQFGVFFIALYAFIPYHRRAQHAEIFLDLSPQFLLGDCLAVLIPHRFIAAREKIQPISYTPDVAPEEFVRGSLMTIIDDMCRYRYNSDRKRHPRSHRYDKRKVKYLRPGAEM